MADAATIGAALGVYEGTIRRRASCEGWAFEIASRPSGHKYRDFDERNLPPEIQRKLGIRPSTPAFAGAGTADLKDYQRRHLEARLAILHYLDELALQADTFAQAVAIFLAQQAAGALPPDVARQAPIANARPRGGPAKISRATLFLWVAMAKKGLAALATKAAPEAPVQAWADTFMRLWARPSKPNLSECLDAWPVTEPKPSYDQARRFVKRLDALTRNAGRLGPRALKSLKAYTIRTVENLWPGAVFIGDGHTFKAEVAHPIHGRPFRPEITAILDVKTRSWVGWSAALSENTWSVADALRHAVTNSTCCDIFYYDNGAGAKNATWDADVTGIVTRLGITKLHSAPWSSQARGVVERFHSTVLHRVARALPTYTGQRMDKEARQAVFKLTRRELVARSPSKIVMSWPAFLELIERARQAYNARPHSALARIIDPVSGRRRHQSPDDAWSAAVAAGWNAEPIAAAEARELFRPATTRTVSRGTVALFNNVYFHPALEQLHGEEVTVAFDIHDAKSVQVQMPDGRFVCDAEWNANARDYVPVAFAERARQQRIEGRLKRLEVHRAEALAEGTPNLTLVAAAAPEPLALTAEQAAAHAKLVAEFEQPPAAEPDPDSEMRRRIWRALCLRQQTDAGEAIAETDAAWLERYVKLPEFSALSRMYDDFGATMFEFYEWFDATRPLPRTVLQALGETA